ncbi:(2Fe-2S)-binding protein [candidate division KSB1 bacterium]|nr:(2Fe-2S)-binding protein [candidate division KSB1 bacterium]RQW00849.1 MAG: (2Fe-2S)-binding protein [candidate division KSB1 bacterium]
MSEEKKHDGLSRRSFLKGVGGGVVGTAVLTSSRRTSAAEQYGDVVGPDAVEITLNVNGQKRTLTVDPRVTLLDALRDQLSLTGSKRVCNKGQCGACTLICNGRTVLACSMLAIDADGADVETIEGLKTGDQLHPVQEEFIKNDALQCGFCTPGFIMSSVALLRKNPSPSMEEIKYAVSGNLCRCGTYPHVFKAVHDAAQAMKKGG